MIEIFLKKSIANTIVFPLFTAGTATRKSGATLAAGDVKVCLHTAGAWSVANPTTATPTEIGTTGLYALPLTIAELTPDNTQYPIIIAAHDVAGAQWDDQQIAIRVYDADFDDLMPSQVWAYADRALTQYATADTTGASGDTITARRGDTMAVSLTGLGDISSVDKIWFTVKRDANTPDAKAILMICKITTPASNKIVYINGAAAGTDEDKGSITIDDALTGDITINLDAEIAAVLPAHNALVYDVQVLDGSDVDTLAEGTFKLLADVTLAVI